MTARYIRRPGRLPGESAEYEGAIRDSDPWWHVGAALAIVLAIAAWAAMR